MPQIEYPYSYLAEAFQVSLFGAGLLVLLGFYVLPAVLEARTSAIVAAASKSPMEGFSVPLGLNLAPTSLTGGVAQVLTLNMVGVYSILSLVLLGAWLAGSRGNTLLATRAGAVLVEQSVLDTVRAIVGPARGVLGWYAAIVTLVIMLATANLMGNVPGGYTLTTSGAVAATLSLGVWLWVTSQSLMSQGVRFWGSFVPSGTPLLLVPILAPIELISYTARAFSLGIRLVCNMLAGHSLLAILADFMLAGLSAGWLVSLASAAMLTLYTALILLEVAVSLIQAYVFSVLTVSYLEGATD